MAAADAARARVIGVEADRLWEIICDPHHLPRWWPRVARVEGVDESRFTQVLPTQRGRSVRADFTVTRRDVPAALTWEQQLAGTPFAGVLHYCRIEITLDPRAAQSTEVTITQSQRLRGYSLTGGLMLRRATGRRLDEALAGLAAVSGAPAATGR